jgi:hypothetical protein
MLIIKNTVHIMLILHALIRADFLLMGNFMELSDPQEKDQYGIQKMLQIRKISPKKLRLLKLMLNFVTLLSILKYKPSQLLLPIFVPRLQMASFCFGLLIRNYQNKNLLN